MTAAFAAKVFAGLIAVAALFQLALALGVPWGEFAMGGAFPRVYPPEMRAAALVQMVALVGCCGVILSRAGLALQGWRQAARWLSWVVVGLLAISLGLNLMTPSGIERLIWSPVALALLLTATRVAVS